MAAPADTNAPAATTGHPAVDDALRALDEAADAPPASQIPAFEAAHRVLQQTLATIDETTSDEG
ncbi:MAG: hypothetical protein IRZ05_14780 [Micromonosporaceae bacterium]|nr:hypothetical protein [Micromonosporaceae bacterium]